MKRAAHPWDQMYAYFLEQGFPRELLDFVCIRREEALQIVAILQKKQPRAILEIGTFIGLSTGVLALTSPPNCTVVGIDPNFPVRLLSQDMRSLAAQPGFGEQPALSFLKQMLAHFAINHKVQILEGYFSHASSAYRDRFVARGGDPQLIDHRQVATVGMEVGAFAPYDLVFLDGDHSTEVVYHDLLLLQRYLAEDGIIILHDVDEQNYWEPCIRAGVKLFCRDFREFTFDRRGNLGFLSTQSVAGYL